ncbi:Chromatin-remodeling complex subunit ies6 [Nosema granulosis]|uniref:Chromatin-remodeling complex subunit ies6 n=1 Tax=Nosema granulosis TaxID=83296 RepID=A0A9P6H2T4_9MICR|nr:Chromatin-remodeling complex subunit ies6 [Nosema granulosis]
MTVRRLRRNQIDEEDSSSVEDTKYKRKTSVAEEEINSSVESTEDSESIEEHKPSRRSKPKDGPPRKIRKKVVDQENLHNENINVVKYSTYKLGNFKNRSMKVFTKDMDIYKMKYMEIASRYSERPKKKVCEFTGLPAMFTFPNSRLYYYDSSVYKHIKMLSSDLVTFIYGTKEICKNFDPFKIQY